MSGIVIRDDRDRSFLCEMIATAKVGTIVEMRLDPLTDPQRKKIKAMCADVAKQVQHEGRFYDASQWQILFMHACGQEVEMMPSLDGSTFIPYEGKSSKMGKQDAGELIAFIEAWGTQNGVIFKEIA
ncbi:recombination protein NinB [Bradyrhizobium sp. PMVTL-01]|uniref:recombination protein NinB n=1 Tax=Bradyrhizobium sp. PMVTL-01 TaxID=3434999 RepID=UPI003F717E1C